MKSNKGEIMKRILVAALAAFVIGCEQPGVESATLADTGPGISAPMPVIAATLSDFDGQWTDVKAGVRQYCQSSADGWTCGETAEPVACMQTGVLNGFSRMNADFNFDGTGAPFVWNWSGQSESLSYDGDSLTFSATGLTVGADLVSVDAFVWTFADGCSMKLERN